MRKVLFVSVLLAFTSFAFAQKPPLNHSVYDDWKSVNSVIIPYDGEWMITNVAAQDGDGYLLIRNLKKGTEYNLPRAGYVGFAKKEGKLICRIAPTHNQTRNAKIAKKKQDEMPLDTLAILDLKSGNIHKIPELKEVSGSTVQGQYVAFRCAAEKKDNYLYLINIVTFAVDTLKDVGSYTFDNEGSRLAFINKPQEKDSLAVKGVYLYNPASQDIFDVFVGDKKAFLSKLSFDRNNGYLTFFAAVDTTKGAEKEPDIYLYDGTAARMIATSRDINMPAGWAINTNGNIVFSNDGKNIFFGIAKKPHEKDTTVPDFEKAKLDIWTWNEDYLQSAQVSNLSQTLKKNYIASVPVNGQTPMLQLGDDEADFSIRNSNIESSVLCLGDKPYRVMRQWDQNPRGDLYKISLEDGSRKMVMKEGRISLYGSSPDGRYYPYYDAQERNWYLYDVETDDVTNLTDGLGVAFYDEENDRPEMPSPYGNLSWSRDGRFLYISDKYDVWQFDALKISSPTMLTEGRGRETETSYTIVFPNDKTGVERMLQRQVDRSKPVYFSMFNHKTKEYGFAVKEIAKPKAKLTVLVEGPYNYDNLVISEGKKPAFVYQKGNFETGNNVWFTSDNFKTEQQITDINPQQRDYNWGTVELVSWTARDGKAVEGLLFKPEDFNPAKKYPVMIYFYERNSDGLYSPRVPAPSRSTVNIPYYVSNDYIVFVPDIYYKVGHPGQSALDYILPGCDMLCEYPWIDGDNMAIQGQSWGGYQVAYMITQTDRFKAAGSGAPVSNMTSAYGGIRWGTGVTRQFQYEQQQSRIGKTLWDGFDLYVENSPLFFVPNVKTPVLIMHNDKDTAVPWWQGIEFFVALRRCGKVAWMLQYNDELHNLSQRKNCKDLTVRMQQFFDHYLKGAPMPDWMEYGVSATEKE